MKRWTPHQLRAGGGAGLIRSSSLGRKLAQAGLKGRVPTAVIVTEEFLRVSPVLRAYTNYLTFVVT